LLAEIMVVEKLGEVLLPLDAGSGVCSALGKFGNEFETKERRRETSNIGFTLDLAATSAPSGRPLHEIDIL
jgi:hypothetical protein